MFPAAPVIAIRLGREFEIFYKGSTCFDPKINDRLTIEDFCA
jgi:hypothetical protein